MRERRDRARFALNLASAEGSVGEVLREHIDRHLAAEPEVARG